MPTDRKPRRCYRLRQRRERQKLTQRELGEQIGVHRWPAQYIGTLERVDAGLEDPNGASADRIQVVRRHLLWMETSKRRRREELRQHENRVAFQRSLWAALPDHPAVRALKAAMLDRCLDLMHEGAGEETDAIAEFLPEPDVEAMFRQWERECEESERLRAFVQSESVAPDVDKVPAVIFAPAGDDATAD